MTLSPFLIDPHEYVPPKHKKPRQHNRVDTDGNRKPFTTKEIREYADKMYYDKYAAKRAVEFFRRQLIHVVGPLKDQLFKLESWQVRVIRRAFGWKWKRDNTRVIREIYIEIPRKNGKTFIVSGFGLYLLFADDEPGANIVCAAASVEQAQFLFSVSREQVRKNPIFKNLAPNPYKGNIAVVKTNSTFKVVSSEGDTAHGGNLHGVIVDEVHVQKSRDLIDALTTSISGRLQPLTIMLTTAGKYDRESIAWETHEDAINTIDRVHDNPSLLAVVFAADAEDDWTDVRIWYKANPNLGVSKTLDYMISKCNKAKRIPSYENTFKQLDLNIWTEQVTRWVSLKRWDMCAGPLVEENMKRVYAYGGLDLADTDDMASFALVWPYYTGEFVIDEETGDNFERVMHYVKAWYWVPEGTMKDRDRKSQIELQRWIDRGFIEAVPGEVINPAYVRKKILELRDQYHIREIAYDPWNCSETANVLEGEGLTMIRTHQGFKTLSEPTKKFGNFVLTKDIAHAGHPVLRWNVTNVAIDSDAANNIKPSKKKSSGKIDGVACVVNALTRVILMSKNQSSYKSRGIQTF